MTDEGDAEREALADELRRACSRVTCATPDRCLAEALAAYDDARMAGLCAEGAAEVALGALHRNQGSGRQM